MAHEGHRGSISITTTDGTRESSNDSPVSFHSANSGDFDSGRDYVLEGSVSVEEADAIDRFLRESSGQQIHESSIANLDNGDEQVPLWCPAPSITVTLARPAPARANELPRDNALGLTLPVEPKSSQVGSTLKVDSCKTAAPKENSLECGATSLETDLGARVSTSSEPSDDTRSEVVLSLLQSSMLENAKLSLRLEQLERSQSQSEAESLLAEALTTIVHLEDDLAICLEEISSFSSSGPAVDTSAEKQTQLEKLQAQFKDAQSKAASAEDKLRKDLDAARKRLAAQETELNTTRDVRRQLVALHRSLDESETQRHATQARLDEAMAKNKKHELSTRGVVAKMQGLEEELNAWKRRAQASKGKKVDHWAEASQ